MLEDDTNLYPRFQVMKQKKHSCMGPLHLAVQDL